MESKLNWKLVEEEEEELLRLVLELLLRFILRFILRLVVWSGDSQLQGYQYCQKRDTG